MLKGLKGGICLVCVPCGEVVGVLYDVSHLETLLKEMGYANPGSFVLICALLLEVLAVSDRGDLLVDTLNTTGVKLELGDVGGQF